MSGAIQLLLAAKPPLVSDPYFELTTMLLPGNGTNGAQNNTFLDSSTNAFSITRNGNTTQGTFSPFSQTGWGNYFNGPNTGSYLRTPVSTDFQLGTSDFTIEFWAFTTSGASDTTVCQTDFGGSGYYGMLLNYHDATNVTWYATSNGSSWNVVNGGVLCTVASIKNTWAHFAYVRSGTTFTAYVNGTAVYTTTSSASIYQSANQFVFGSSYAGSHPSNFGGYLSNFRYVKGTAVYTGNFTPSTTPLTAITNTKLLSCQSNRFIDASASAHTLTIGGSPSVQAFSPFNPTAAWSAATYGGSAYFDGSGDYLTVADNAAFEMTADFTIEAWFYLNTLPGAGDFADIVTKGAAAIYQPYYIFVNPSGSLLFYSSSTGSSWDVASGVSFGTVTTGQWYHVAVSRSGTSLRMFLNGALISTITNGNALYDNNRAVTVGARSDGTEDKLKGYICDVRLVKGTAVYTAAFTPPTAPLTAITNTSLLLNFTNAGIYDATSKNDLETVGNAQISTTQSKFGGSSMYFDGTGDYLVPNVATSNLYAFGSGDWTIEMWVYSATNQSAMLLDWRPTSTSGAYITWYLGTGVPVLFVNAADRIIGGSAIPTNEWVHLAICRASGSTKMFVNGTQSGSTYSDSNVYLNSANRPLIASNGYTIGGSPSYFTGYIQDLRITKGYARYTTGFTPPTAAFPLL